MTTRVAIYRAARERAIEATLDVVTLESIGTESFDEWARRLDGYASRLVLAHRFVEARMVAAYAAVLDA